MKSFLLIKTQLLCTFGFFTKSFLLAKGSIHLLLKFLQAKKNLICKIYLAHSFHFLIHRRNICNI